MPAANYAIAENWPTTAAIYWLVPISQTKTEQKMKIKKIFVVAVDDDKVIGKKSCKERITSTDESDARGTDAATKTICLI